MTRTARQLYAGVAAVAGFRILIVWHARHDSASRRGTQVEIIGFILNGVALIIGIPLGLLMLGGAVHAVAFHIIPSCWDQACHHANVTWLRVILAAIYSVALTAIAIAMLDAGCARFTS